MTALARLDVATAVAVLVAALAPSAVLAEDRRTCKRKPTGPRFTAGIVYTGERVERTAVAVCDRRTGRRRFVRRAALRDPDGEPRGRIVDDVAIADRVLAWTETVVRAKGSTGILVVADPRTGRVRRRRVIDQVSAARDLEVEVAVSVRGDLAYVGRGRLTLERRGRRPRVVSRRGPSAAGFDADGRTLHWVAGTGTPGMRFLDLEPPRVRAGCPRRAGYETLPPPLATIAVTQASYGNGGGGTYDVVRACLRGSGRDRVVATGADDEGAGRSHAVAGGTGDWLALTETEYWSKAGDCSTRVFAVNVITGATGRRSGALAWLCGYASAPAAGSVVVTSLGAAAWLVRDGADDVVGATGPDGTVELDRAPAGQLGDVRADGELVRWTRAGEPRDARP